MSSIVSAFALFVSASSFFLYQGYESLLGPIVTIPSTVAEAREIVVTKLAGRSVVNEIFGKPKKREPAPIAVATTTSSTTTLATPQASTSVEQLPVIIEDTLGYASTSFKGSSNDRISNISLGASRIRGKVIMPGETFSTLEALKPFSKEAGYKEEHVIKATSSPLELGGGLCQVSTTLFRTALSAGLPIVERTPHSYIVGYYGAGKDATVYFPYTDFRFKNDYAYPIRVESNVTDTDVSFTIVGINDGRVATTTEVETSNIIPKPETVYIQTTEIPLGEVKCTETARRGMDTEFTYNVSWPTGSSTKKTFYSTYKPWAAVCYVGVLEVREIPVQSTTTPN